MFQKFKWMVGRRGISSLDGSRLLLMAALLVPGPMGCSFSAPPRIELASNSEVFSVGGEANENSSDQAMVSQLAEACTKRLNSQRDAAAASFFTRTSFSVATAVVGGGVGGTGGVVAFLSENTETENIGATLAVAGGVIAIIGAAVAPALAEPTERATVHRQALPYFNRAIDALADMRPATDEKARSVAFRRAIRNLRICMADGDESQVPEPSSDRAREAVVQPAAAEMQTSISAAASDAVRSSLRSELPRLAEQLGQQLQQQQRQPVGGLTTGTGATPSGPSARPGARGTGPADSGVQ